MYVIRVDDDDMIKWKVFVFVSDDCIVLWHCTQFVIHQELKVSTQQKTFFFEISLSNQYHKT